MEKPAGAGIDMISTGPAGTWVAQYFGSGEFQLHKRTGSSWTGYPLPMRLAKDVQARTATDAWVVGSVGDTDEARVLPRPCPSNIESRRLSRGRAA